MSAAIPKLAPKLVLDPRLAWNSFRNFAVVKGGLNSQSTVLPCTGNITTSNVTFVPAIPDPGTGVSKLVLIRMYYRLNFTGTCGSNGRLLAPGLYDAPRMCPLAQTTPTTNLTINGNGTSFQTSQLINLLMTMVTDDEVRRNLSMTPTFQDQYPNYDDVWANALGIGNDPITNQGDSYKTHRGAFPYTVVSNPNNGAGNAGTAEVLITVTEPLWLSPLSSVEDDQPSFVGVNDMQIILNFGNINRIWSHNAKNAAAGIINPTTGLVVSFPQNPEILMTYIKPSVLQPVPKSVVYDYNFINFQALSSPITVAGKATAIAPQFTFTTSYVPKRMYFWVERQTPDQTMETSDFFGVPLKISIDYNNTTYFAQTSQQQLYYISREAGVQMSWTEALTRGFPLVFDVNRSIMLASADTEAPGLVTNKQIAVNLTFVNPSSDTVTFTVKCAFVADGICSLEDKQCNFQNTVLTENDVISVGTTANLASFFSKPASFFGGKLRELGTTVRGKIRNMRGGDSFGGDLIGGDLIGGSLISEEDMDDDLVGGAMVSKSTLKQRAMERARTLRK